MMLAGLSFLIMTLPLLIINGRYPKAYAQVLVQGSELGAEQPHQYKHTAAGSDLLYKTKHQRSSRTTPVTPASAMSTNPSTSRSRGRGGAGSSQQQSSSSSSSSSTLTSYSLTTLMTDAYSMISQALGGPPPSAARVRASGGGRQTSQAGEDSREKREEELEKHFEWRKYARQAKENEAKGDLYQALSLYQSILHSDTLQAGMRDNERYQVYISAGRLQLRLGLLQSAETTLFQATCLVSEPHEAYLALAKLKTSQGCLDEGTMHYKHYLFYRPECLAALQELGSLLIISGSVNEGRHYLLRALTQWERDVRRLVARLRFQANHPEIPFSRWFLQYLFANLSLGPPQSGFDEDGRFAMVAEFIDRPQPFTARLHWELSAALWKAGLSPQSLAHLRAARMLADHDKYSDSDGPVAGPPISAHTGQLASLRLRLNFPPFLPSVEAGHEALEAWRRGIEEEEDKGNSLDQDTVLEIFSPLPTLLSHITSWGTTNDLYLLSSTIDHACPTLAPQPPIFLPRSADKPIRLGLISGLMFGNPVGKLSQTLLRLLPRPDFHITVFAFPSPYNGTLDTLMKQIDNLVILPVSIQRARATILTNQMDILLLPDSLDAMTYFMGYSRMAPLQMAFFAKGTTTGLPELDYYIRPTAVSPRAVADYTEGLDMPTETHSEQVVAVDGPSYLLPFLLSMVDVVEVKDDDGSIVRVPEEEQQEEEQPLPLTPLRYEFYGHYFFEHNHVYILHLPNRLASLPHPIMDQLLISILDADPSAEIVLMLEEDLPEPNTAVAPTSLVAHQLLLRRIIQRHGGTGDRAYLPRVRLMPALKPNERLELLALASCILEPIPHGYFPTFAVLEGMSSGVPVVSLGGVWAGLMDVLGVVDLGSSAITNHTKYVEAAVRLGSDKEFRHTQVELMREGMAREYEKNEDGLGRELGRTLKGLMGGWEEREKEGRRKRKKQEKQRSADEEEDEEDDGKYGRRSRYRRGSKPKRKDREAK